MQTLLHIAGALLIAFGMMIICASYILQIRNFRNRHYPGAGWSSPAPVVGPLLVVVGYAMLPLRFSTWIFLVFVLDPDTVITLVSIPWAIWRSRRQSNV